MKKIMFLSTISLLLIGCEMDKDTTDPPKEIDMMYGSAEYAPHGVKSFSLTSISGVDVLSLKWRWKSG